MARTIQGDSQAAQVESSALFSSNTFLSKCACNHLQRDVNGDGVRSAGRTPTRGLTDVTSVVSGSAMVETQHQTVSICGIRTCKHYNYYLIYCLLRPHYSHMMYANDK